MIYNQKIKSDLFLPEAVIIEPLEQIDIQIELGEPPQWVFEQINRGQIDYFDEKVMWIYLQGVVLFYIENGNRIVIYRESYQLSEAELRSYLTGVAMALAMMQKNYIPVHGGTVAWEGQAIIISGISGAGKSTVTMEMFEQGFQFVADDLSVLAFEEDKMLVYPGVPQQKVCRDVVVKEGYKTEDLIYINEKRDKFARILKSGYVTEPISVICMIELIVSKYAEDLSYEVVAGVDKFHQLCRNIYRGEVYQRLENQPERFRMFLRAAEKMPMYRITRPKHGDYVNDIICYIRKEILQERLVKQM